MFLYLILRFCKIYYIIKNCIAYNVGIAVEGADSNIMYVDYFTTIYLIYLVFELLINCNQHLISTFNTFLD